MLPHPRLLLVAGVIALAGALLLMPRLSPDPPEHVLAQSTPDLGDWGSDHVGKALPEYMTGGECLFCHRNKIGPTWQPNRHNRTMRIADSESPAVQAATAHGDISHLLGGGERTLFLKPNGKYGQLALLSAQWKPAANGQGYLDTGEREIHWDNDRFGKACAGCHATAVDPEYTAFSAISLDCYTCHGEVPDGHQNEPAQALFAKNNDAGARVETAICAQCHLRTGKSRTTGLPYPTNFVAGDNLFRDFEVDFSDEHIAQLSDSDKHVLINVRDVVLNGREEMTCTSCHDIHDQSTRRHRTLKKLQRNNYCMLCHDNLEDWTSTRRFGTHSKTCQLW